MLLLGIALTCVQSILCVRQRHGNPPVYTCPPESVRVGEVQAVDSASTGSPSTRHHGFWARRMMRVRVVGRPRSLYVVVDTENNNNLVAIITMCSATQMDGQVATEPDY